MVNVIAMLSCGRMCIDPVPSSSKATGSGRARRGQRIWSVYDMEGFKVLHQAWLSS